VPPGDLDTATDVKLNGSTTDSFQRRVASGPGNGSMGVCIESKEPTRVVAEDTIAPGMSHRPVTDASNKTGRDIVEPPSSEVSLAMSDNRVAATKGTGPAVRRRGLRSWHRKGSSTLTYPQATLIIKEGPVEKQTKMLKRWKKHWLKLTANTLEIRPTKVSKSISHSEDEKAHCHIYSIEDVVCEYVPWTRRSFLGSPRKSKLSKIFDVVYKAGEGIHHLRAATSQDAAAWHEAIGRARARAHLKSELGADTSKFAIQRISPEERRPVGRLEKVDEVVASGEVDLSIKSGREEKNVKQSSGKSTDGDIGAIETALEGKPVTDAEQPAGVAGATHVSGALHAADRTIANRAAERHRRRLARRAAREASALQAEERARRIETERADRIVRDRLFRMPIRTGTSTSPPAVMLRERPSFRLKPPGSFPGGGDDSSLADDSTAETAQRMAFEVPDHSWILVVDQPHDCFYFFNEITGKSTWQRPQGMSNALGWCKALDAESRVLYWINEKTGETCWQSPSMPGMLAAAVGP
jgi:hypothetical protein